MERMRVDRRLVRQHGAGDAHGAGGDRADLRLALCDRPGYLLRADVPAKPGRPGGPAVAAVQPDAAAFLGASHHLQLAVVE